MEPLTASNQEWAADFISDGMATGQSLRILSVVEGFDRRCLELEGDTSFAGLRVTRVLDHAIDRYGRPQRLRVDNGPEFTSRHFLAWAVERKIEIVYIRPGRPGGERLCRELSWTAARRVPERELVSQSMGCAGEVGMLAGRV